MVYDLSDWCDIAGGYARQCYARLAKLRRHRLASATAAFMHVWRLCKRENVSYDKRMGTTGQVRHAVSLEPLRLQSQAVSNKPSNSPTDDLAAQRVSAQGVRGANDEEARTNEPLAVVFAGESQRGHCS